MKRPHWIQFPKIGAMDIGYISVAEYHNLPFEVKRCYWTYYTPESVVRGRHAHHFLEQVLIAVAGRIEVFTEEKDDTKAVYILDHPEKGLYLPTYCWHTLRFSHNAVLLSLCSMSYDEKDYIREYSDFLDIKGRQTD